MRRITLRISFCFLLVSAAVFAHASGSNPGKQETLIDLRKAGNGEEAVRFFPWGEDGVLLQSQGWNATFTRGSREFHFNGVRIFLGAPVRVDNGGFYISGIDSEAVLGPLLNNSRALDPSLSDLQVIAIDAGHGGDDLGGASILPGINEKDVVLEVSLLLKALLDEVGFRVVMTRKTDQFVSLADRTEIADAAGADLFISIHMNATGSPSVHGTETYVLTPRNSRSTSQAAVADGDDRRYPGNDFDSRNALLGFVVQDQLLRDLETVDRGLKRARFMVLREARCPAVLVEAGFLTHPVEAELLASTAYQHRLAGSLATAVNRYALMIRRMRRD